MSERADLDRAGYVPGYGTAAGQYMAVRTASNSADFFLPHLRPGMNVLDCGCGSGTITTGLAEVVSPGEVVGVDHEPVQVEQARALAAERGVDNVRFETADVFALPFADGTFDAAFAHAVLMHVGDRVAALREMRRVVRPGGVVAIKDLRGEDQIMEPSTPLLREFFDLLDRVRAHHGVPQSSPQLYRALMRESGLTDVEASASCRSYGTPEHLRVITGLHLSQARGIAFRQTATEAGWATNDHLDDICNEIEAWCEHPDAFRVELWCAGVGRVPA